jgi:hypothetical protein
MPRPATDAAAHSPSSEQVTPATVDSDPNEGLDRTGPATATTAHEGVFKHVAETHQARRAGPGPLTGIRAFPV